MVDDTRAGTVCSVIYIHVVNGPGMCGVVNPIGWIECAAFEAFHYKTYVTDEVLLDSNAVDG